MQRISRIILAGFAAAALATHLGGIGPAFAKEKTTMVGGAPMYPSKNIVQNAVNSKDHTTLVAAVKAAVAGGVKAGGFAAGNPAELGVVQGGGLTGTRCGDCIRP